MNFDTFERWADAALASHTAFANFVAKTEFLSDDPHYAAAWLEAEIVNALALDAWEANGRAPDWAAEWERAFKAEAVEVVAALKEATKSVFVQ